MIQASIFEYLSSYSVEHLYSYLRFQAFPNISNDKMKELLLAAMSVPCREEDILTKILDYAKKKDADGLFQYFKKNKFPINKEGKPLKDPEQMLDIFLSEENQHNACRALKVLLRFPIYNGDISAYNDFIKNWKTINDPFKKEEFLQLFDYSELIV
jgi:hypothetical protein